MIWARIGGGFERLDDGARHGPADLELRPPGPDLQPLIHDGVLSGWTNVKPTPALAQHAFEEGRRLASERRSQLLGRLGHKLRSAVLSLQESSRQAAFGRPELLEVLYEQAQEVGRRAAALEAAALDPKDTARFVVVGALLNTAAPDARIEVPGDAVVRAPEPVLFEALQRTYEWMGGMGMRLGGERSGAWWKLFADPAPSRRPLAAPELGEPLIRLLVDIHIGGWLDARADRAVLWLPAT